MPSHEEGVVRWGAWILAASIAVHLALLACSWRWPDMALVHLPLHAGSEIAGALIGLGVALALLALEGRGGTSCNVAFANALVAMAILDGAHGLLPAGQAFVWLHSLSTLVGGLLFAAVALPRTQSLTPRSTLMVGLLAAVVAIASILIPDRLPSMIVSTSAGPAFSWVAQVLNVGGGIAFLGAAAMICGVYRRSRNADDLLFCLHCVLFGLAAVMFEQSRLWDVAWWGWHGLRVLAYAAAGWFIVRTVLAQREHNEQLSRDLAQFATRLEERVTARTAQLEAANRELELSNADLQRFATVASHDLKAPLRRIQSFSAMLDEELESADGDARRLAGRIAALSGRLQRLIEGILSYSRVGGAKGELTRCSLADAVTDALSLLEHDLAAHGASVDVHPLPAVRAEYDQLVQLLQNLISNGVKYCERTPHIVISSHIDGDWCEVAVTDNGIGIAEEHRGKVFEMFSRLHNDQEYEGSGVGLAVCLRIVKRHGGHITLRSEVGLGSTFSFTLPCANVTPHAA